MAGLLGDGWEDPQTQFNLMLAAGLLGGRGRFGQVVGNALPGAMQARQQAQAAIGQRETQALQRRLMDAQINETQAQAEQRRRKKEYIPVGRNVFHVPTQQWVQAPDGPDPDEPSDVRKFKFWKKLTPDEQTEFLNVIRQNYQVTDIGGVPSSVRKGPNPSVTPLSNLPSEATAKGALAAAQAGGQASGAAQAKARIDMPTVSSNAKALTTLVDDLLKHPGLQYSTGVLGVVPAVPGTIQGDFVARHDQIKGKQFLQAYETLKGGGQITEIEGQKATDAMSRMRRATTTKAFVEAAKEFKSEIARLEQIARQRAGESSGDQPKKLLTFDPATGDFK